jgi:hypothetical protein
VASIDCPASVRRSILGHGIAVDQEHFLRAREILNDAFERIRSLTPEPRKTEEVYYVQLALFPLTGRKKS